MNWRFDSRCSRESATPVCWGGEVFGSISSSPLWENGTSVPRMSSTLCFISAERQCSWNSGPARGGGYCTPFASFTIQLQRRKHRSGIHIFMCVSDSKLPNACLDMTQSAAPLRRTRLIARSLTYTWVGLSLPCANNGSDNPKPVKTALLRISNMVFSAGAVHTYVRGTWPHTCSASLQDELAYPYYP
jgi:hypothetical protein